MKKYYYKSKYKILGMILSFAMILAIGVIITILYLDLSRGTQVVIISGYILFCLITMPKLKSLGQEYLILEDDQIKFISPPLTWRIEIQQIKTFRYKGIRWIPVFENLIIETDLDSINIDFNFHNYSKVWSEVLTICKNKNQNLIIDHRLQKRLNFK